MYEILHASKWKRSWHATFIKIKDLSEDMFCTGDIVTVDYCMEVYTQFLNNEPFDFFIAATREIRDTFNKLDRELFNFQRHLEQLFRLFYSLLPKKSRFKKRLYETEQMFQDDLIKQLAKFVKTEHRRGIFGKNKFFLYIKFFSLEKLFCVTIFFLYQNFFSINFFFV